MGGVAMQSSQTAFPEHRQRSRYGNTHVDCRTGIRTPTQRQFAFQQRIIVDVNGYCRPGSSMECRQRGLRSTPESSANSSINKLRMVYNLRAATPDLPYNPATLEPEPIARTNLQSFEQLQREKA